MARIERTHKVGSPNPGFWFGKLLLPIYICQR